MADAFLMLKKSNHQRFIIWLAESQFEIVRNRPDGVPWVGKYTEPGSHLLRPVQEFFAYTTAVQNYPPSTEIPDYQQVAADFLTHITEGAFMKSELRDRTGSKQISCVLHKLHQHELKQGEKKRQKTRICTRAKFCLILFCVQDWSTRVTPLREKARWTTTADITGIYGRYVGVDQHHRLRVQLYYAMSQFFPAYRLRFPCRVISCILI